MEERRLEFIDAIKGFTMILVIMGHICQKYRVFSYFPSEALVIIWVERIIYSFHMPLFMLISGYIFFHAYLSSNYSVNKERLTNHLINLFLVYLLFSIFEGIIKIFFSRYVVSQVEWGDILLICVKPIGGRMWYLYVLIEYYIFFSFRGIRKYIGKPMLSIIILVMALVSYFMDYEWLFSIKRAFLNILPFYFGMIISKNKVDYIIQKNSFRFLSFMIVLIRLILYMLGYSSNELCLISVLYGTIIATWLLYLFKQVRRLSYNRIFTVIGICSMEMYLLHEYPVTFGVVVISRLFDEFWLSLTFSALITVISILIIDTVLKKMKLSNFIFRPWFQVLMISKRKDKIGA